MRLLSADHQQMALCHRRLCPQQVDIMKPILARLGRALSGSISVQAFLVPGGQPWRVSSCRGCSVGPHPWDNIERRCQRLESFLKRLIRPQRLSFVANGQLYSLPVRAQKLCIDIAKVMPNEELEYLAGFFDGDGCVYSTVSFRNRRLEITQAENNVAVLLRFMNQFGGGIYQSGRHVIGGRQHCFRWSLGGERVRSVAPLLARASCVKREQLDLVALETPTCPRHCSRHANRLRSLKREAPGLCRDVSWAYLAGFFDAEGYIQIKTTHAKLILSISQKFKEPLVAAKALIERSLTGVSTHLELSSKGYYRLSVTSTASSFAVLRQLLSSGLTGKKQQALLALTLNRRNYTNIRDRLSLLKGNQSRRLFLDADGCERARRIRTISARLYRSGGQPNHENEVAYLREQLDMLNHEHRLRNSDRRLRVLRTEIRSLLHQGASRPTG